MAHATFADLPPEMVGNVFAFIRSKPDQSSVCLVNRACRVLMAPMMWERLETDFRNVTPRLLATLIHPDSKIASHVRELGVSDKISSSELEDRLRLILTAIPRDRVRSFECRCPFSTLTLQILLQTQRKIETLEVFTPFTTLGQRVSSEFDSEEHHTWMTSSLPDVKSIELYIATRSSPEERLFEGFKSISENHPKIDVLDLYPMQDTGTEVSSLCGILRHAKEIPLFSNLSSLRLFGLRLGETGDRAISKGFDLSKLSCLQISGCDHIVPFVESFSSYYTSGIGKLDCLYIVLPCQLEQPENSVKAIESLLKVSPKLLCLQLDLSRHGFVAKEYILAHCQTLETLMLGSGESPIGSYFTVTDMTTILRACTRLVYLAVNMPAVHLGAITELGTGFYPEGEFADMLAVISTHPVLEAFRVLNPPTVKFDEDDDTGESAPMRAQVYLCQVLMQHFANKILRYMADRGSNLRVLIIKPSSENVRDDGKELHVDTNGHRWPEYHYARGRLAEVTGTNGVVAHPLRNILLDFPDLVSLLH